MYLFGFDVSFLIVGERKREDLPALLDQCVFVAAPHGVPFVLWQASGRHAQTRLCAQYHGRRVAAAVLERLEHFAHLERRGHHLFAAHRGVELRDLRFEKQVDGPEVDQDKVPSKQLARPQKLWVRGSNEIVPVALRCARELLDIGAAVLECVFQVLGHVFQLRLQLRHVGDQLLTGAFLFAACKQQRHVCGHQPRAGEFFFKQGAQVVGFVPGLPDVELHAGHVPVARQHHAVAVHEAGKEVEADVP